MKVILHIDRLTLRGVSPEHRESVVASLREGLQQAFAHPGVAAQWATSGHRERVRGQLPAPAEPASLGRDAAQHIAGGAKP